MKSGSPRPIQLGFIPVSDCAPLVVAHERGLFAKYGVEVELRREIGWSNVRDKVMYGELDGAHAPATLPFVTNLGLDSDQCACVAGMVLSLQGNAITIASNLYNKGAQTASGLKDLIFRDWGKRTYTFGVVFPYSSQYFLLRQWLKSGGINPEVEIRVVVLPPSQMFPSLKLGYLDGFCVGEPWTSVAVEAGAGVCVATSQELAPLHPEKVLMVRHDFAESRPEVHERLIAALIEACGYCDSMEHRAEVCNLLARPQYVNAPADCLRAGLVGPFESGERRFSMVADQTIFSRHNANDPTDDKSAWVMEQLYELLDRRVLKTSAGDRIPALKNVFRHDIFERALALARKSDARCEINQKDRTPSNEDHSCQTVC